jgi:hypothetical protein
MGASPQSATDVAWLKDAVLDSSAARDDALAAKGVNGTRRG